jgi:hypothetical protein
MSHTGQNATVYVVFLRLNWGEAMSTRLPLSFNRARVLEAIALIVFASLVIAFVHSGVPYLAD